MQSKSITLSLTIAVVACLTTAPRAVAEPSSWRPAASQYVPLAGLDLNREADAAIALRRLRHAARDICGQPGPSAEIARVTDRCVANVVDRAVASLNRPLLTAMNHSGRADRIMTASR